MSLVIDLILRMVAAGRELFTIVGFLINLRQSWLAIAAIQLPAFGSRSVLRVLPVLRGLGPFLTTRSSKVGMEVGLTSPMVLNTAALSVYEAERFVDGLNTTSFGDAIWWAFASVTTVGYGDRFFVAEDGRLIATMLIAVGIGLFSSLTAILSAQVMGERSKQN